MMKDLIKILAVLLWLGGSACWGDVTTGLVADIPMQDNAPSTVVVDNINADGVLTGANTADISTTGPNAFYPSAFNMNGSSHRVNFTSQVMTGDYTTSIWAKRDGTSRIDCACGAAATSSFIYFPANSTQIFLRGADSGGSAAFSHGVDTTQWHHYVTGRSGLAVFLYVDGVDLSISKTSASDNCTWDQIGRYDTSAYFDGSLAGMRVYGRALSAGDVAELYALGSASSSILPILQHYYHSGSLDNSPQYMLTQTKPNMPDWYRPAENHNYASAP